MDVILDPETIRKLRPGIDIRALRELLGRVPDAVGRQIVGLLTNTPLSQVRPSIGETEGSTNYLPFDPVIDVTFEDEEIQSLFAAVVAPLRWNPFKDVPRDLLLKLEPSHSDTPLVLWVRRGAEKQGEAPFVLRSSSEYPLDIIGLVPGCVSPLFLDRAASVLVIDRITVGMNPDSPRTIAVSTQPSSQILPQWWRERLESLIESAMKGQSLSLRGLGDGSAIACSLNSAKPLPMPHHFEGE